MMFMYVTRVPNRGSPPAVLLRESYRDGGKVKTRTLANLSAWPEAKVEALRQVLKGATVAAPPRASRSSAPCRTGTSPRRWARRAGSASSGSCRAARSAWPSSPWR
jgi:hypothetical protein